MKSADADGALSLDALREDDAPTLHSWRHDPAIRDGALAYPFHASIEAEKEWIRAYAPRGTPHDVCLAIRAAGAGVLLGYCQLRSIDWISRTAEFGIVVGPTESRGQGVGSHALSLMRDYAVQQLGMRRLWLRVVGFNKAAIALYEKAGFVLEGRLVRHAYRNGSFHDVLIYGWETTDGPLAAGADPSAGPV